jgi:hypothetical protein
LEQQPFADADDSFFEEEEYNTVSALLGERAQPFLNIPTGPLQVGHFIGALTIYLMAYIEYPGFPLTNLPTALRESLQSGTYYFTSPKLLLCFSLIFSDPTPLRFFLNFQQQNNQALLSCIQSTLYWRSWRHSKRNNEDNLFHCGLPKPFPSED